MANLTARRRQRLRLTQLRQRYDGTPLVPQEWCRPPIAAPRLGVTHYAHTVPTRGQRASRVWVDEIAGFDPQPELTAENERAAEAMRRVVPSPRRADFGAVGFTYAGSGIGHVAGSAQRAEMNDLMQRIADHWERRFFGPRPLGRIDFDRLVAPRLTETLEHLHAAADQLESVWFEAGIAGRCLTRAASHLTAAGRQVLEAAETVIGR